MSHVLSSAAIREVQSVLKKHGVTSCLLFYEGGKDPRDLESSLLLMEDETISPGNERGEILYMFGITVGAKVIGVDNAHKLVANIDDIDLGKNEVIIDNEN